MNSARIVVLGGGITGLAAAHRSRELAAAYGIPADVTVLERSSRVGGCIETRYDGGFTMELGPDSLVTEKPAAIELAKRLGLDEAIEPMQSRYRGACVLRGGRLVRIPESFRFFTPTSLAALVRSGLFSAPGIARAACEPFAKARANGEDESLASFVKRRFGREVLERLAQPLIGGIYSGDPDELSMKATLPQMLALEQKYGSLVRGMRAAARRARGPAHRMVTLRGGLGTLTTALEHELCDSIRTNAEVRSVERTAGNGAWSVRLSDGTELIADALVCALPAYAAAQLFEPLDAELCALLGRIRYHSVATINLGYATAELPPLPRCTGFVVPQVEQRSIVAATFSSQKYGGRSPEGRTLLRAFAGGALQPSIHAMNESRLVERARGDLRDVLGITARPEFSIVRRFERALPQYSVGHVELVNRIEDRVRRLGPIALAGSAYRGVGIADCVRSGETAALEICERLRDAGSSERAGVSL